MKKACLALSIGAALLALSTGAQNTPLIPSHQPAVPAAAVRPAVESPVARVNGAVLTERDLQREMQKIFPYAGVHGNRMPGGFPPEVRRKALDQILFEELLYQEALRRRMTVSTSMFDDLLQQALSRFPSRAEFESYAAQEYGGIKGFEHQLRRGLLIALFADQEIARKARVSDAQVRQFYNANQNRFRKPASAWIQSISFQLSANATPAQRAQVRQRAEQVLLLAKAARDYEQFGLLAEKYSEDDWRVMMGDHKWIHRGRMPSAVEDVAFTLKAGETSGLIATPEALVIVRVNSTQPQTRIPFTQVQDSLRKDLQEARERDLRARLERQLRKTFSVEER